MKNHFTEEDKQRVIEFLNFIATRAIFPDWKTQDSITHYKLLAHMQQVILPKIEDNILEVKRVIEANESEEK